MAGALAGAAHLTGNVDLVRAPIQVLTALLHVVSNASQMSKMAPSLLCPLGLRWQEWLRADRLCFFPCGSWGEGHLPWQPAPLRVKALRETTVEVLGFPVTLPCSHASIAFFFSSSWYWEFDWGFQGCYVALHHLSHTLSPCAFSLFF
jgi:hypothetical protein